jgi:hypothetical protein
MSTSIKLAETDKLQVDYSNLQRWTAEVTNYFIIHNHKLASLIKNKSAANINNNVMPSVNQLNANGERIYEITKSDIEVLQLSQGQITINYDNLTAESKLKFDLQLKLYINSIPNLEEKEQKAIQLIADALTKELLEKIQNTEEFLEWSDLQLLDNKAYKLFLLITNNKNQQNVMGAMLHLVKAITTKQLPEQSFCQYINELKLGMKKVKADFKPSPEQLKNDDLISIDQLYIAIMLLGMKNKSSFEHDITNALSEANLEFITLTKLLQNKIDLRYKFNDTSEPISEQLQNVGMKSAEEVKDKNPKDKDGKKHCQYCLDHRRDKLGKPRQFYHALEDCKNKKYDERRVKANSIKTDAPGNCDNIPDVNLSDSQLKQLEAFELSRNDQVVAKNATSQITNVLSDEQFNKFMEMYKSNV